MSYRVFLAELLLAECDDRARRRSERRIKAAQFPREKSLREFDFEANPTIDPAVIHTLATSEWVKKGLPLCLIGDSGTGKSHLLISLGTEAAMAGFRVKYTLAAKLVNELVEAADDLVLTKTIARYGRVDLLTIDELGYVQLDRRGAELRFQRRRTPSRSPRTSRSPAGARLSPTHASAQPLSTGSPSAGTSSKPAPSPTGSPTAKHTEQRLEPPRSPFGAILLGTGTTSCQLTHQPT
jgi:DNA replication protein DnaC